MTNTQTELMEQLFNRYGHHSTEPANKTIYLFAPHPNKEYKIAELEKDDKRAKEKIEELQSIIEQLKAYRVAISERYNYLSTAPTTPVIELKRYKNWSDKKVYYYIHHYSRDLNENKDILQETITFSGTERKEAFKYFDKYVAQHPGIIAIKDIEKSPWEK